MSSADLTRNMVQFMIDQNPSTFGPWTRRIRVDDGFGGWRESTVSYGPYTGRVYIHLTRAAPQFLGSPQGIVETDTTFRLLLPSTMPIDGTPNVDDEFDITNYGHFKVLSVTPIMQFGELCGYFVNMDIIA